MENTHDLSALGHRELHELGNLIKAYAQDSDVLGDGVEWEFNQSSGCLFLVDSDYNVAMMNGNNLERFYNCSYCGHEGFAEEFTNLSDYNETEHVLVCDECQENAPLEERIVAHL